MNDTKQNAADFLATQIKLLPDSSQKKICTDLNQRFGHDETANIDAVYTFAEVAEILKRTTRSVQNLISEGHLVAFIPPGRKRAWGVTSKSLKRFVEMSCGNLKEVLNRES